MQLSKPLPILAGAAALALLGSTRPAEATVITNPITITVTDNNMTNFFNPSQKSSASWVITLPAGFNLGTDDAFPDTNITLNSSTVGPFIEPISFFYNSTGASSGQLEMGTWTNNSGSPFLNPGEFDVNGTLSDPSNSPTGALSYAVVLDRNFTSGGALYVGDGSATVSDASNTKAVPEPASAALLLAGLAGLLVARGRRLTFG